VFIFVTEGRNNSGYRERGPEASAGNNRKATELLPTFRVFANFNLGGGPASKPEESGHFNLLVLRSYYSPHRVQGSEHRPFKSATPISFL